MFELKEWNIRGNSILRCAFVGISLLFQVGWLLLLVLRLKEYYAWISLVSGILSLLLVLRLQSKHTTSAMKIPWIILILVFPVMGLSLYLMLLLFDDLGSAGRRMQRIQNQLQIALPQNPQVLSSLEKEDLAVANQFRYLSSHSSGGVYNNTQTQYYHEASDAFAALKESLEKAKNFIFMEYFIVSDTSSFQEIQEILVRKAREGVEVRLMYDDIGSVGYVNLSFAKKLNAQGIQCRVFNPARPVLNVFQNHRDHRKITVIDGTVGFTGGYNLSDEYFDRRRPYGKWKDTGIRLEGDAVRGLTANFLEIWNLSSREMTDASGYLNVEKKLPADGFVQPYGDNPLAGERVAENVYLNMINGARKSLYLMTPYLIITDEMNRALCLAAKRGVDVRIITPGIPDKKTVFAMTRSYYPGLASQGVRIFEYVPGFCHGKQCLCDGILASIGTSNFDYRSLYLHFENNVLMYKSSAVTQMAADFDSLFPLCREVTNAYTGHGKGILRTWQCILRLFAPMV